jgi:hypothetical protein
MADAQTLREVAQARTPFSTWLGVVLLFFMFGMIVLAVIGPSHRGSVYEEKRAANRQTKLQAQREQDAAALTTYGWIDKNKGSVRIPIDRAMELTRTDLGRKKPAPGGPIATPTPAEPPAAGGGVATPPSAPAPPGSPPPSATPKGAAVEGHGSKAQPAAGTNPPGAAPGTQPGPSASPAASSAPAAIPPSSPPPAGTATPPGSPLPVRGTTPQGR